MPHRRPVGVPYSEIDSEVDRKIDSEIDNDIDSGHSEGGRTGARRMRAGLNPAASATMVNDVPYETTHDDDDEDHRPHPRGREHPSSEPEGGCSREKSSYNAFFPIAVTKVLCGLHPA